MTGDLSYTPPAPSGTSELDVYLRWVWDMLAHRNRLIDVPGQITWERTDRGVKPILQLPGRGGIYVPPFQIYQTGTWLDFKVTTGIAIMGGLPVVPTGVELLDGSGGTTKTLTSGVNYYWFYLNLTPTTAVLATNTTTPTWGVDQVPLGWVDTNTYAADEISIIYQFTHDNIFSPCVV